MSRTDTWMPLDIGDYVADTMHLTTLQHGAYLLLLMHYWKTGPLPDDDDQLAAISKMDPKAWKGVRPVIRRFFTPDNGILRQKRADKERQKNATISSERSVAGKAGAEARWKQNGGNPPDKPDGKPMANAKQVLSKPEANGEQKPEVCHDFAAVPVPSPKQEESDSYCLSKEEEAAREGTCPERVETVRAAAKAELLDAGMAGAVVLTLGKELRRKAYPQGRTGAEINDQIEAATPKPTIKAYPLSREQLFAANPARRHAGSH